MKKHFLTMASIIGAIFLVFFFSSSNKGIVTDFSYPHSSLDFPDSVNTLFAGSGKCTGCHGYDPDGLASTDEDGNDVNLVDAWAASMMANSAKDPFWRAKVSHEVLVNPDHQEELESTCTKCHAPLGRFDAMHNGQLTYSIAEMELDSIALDGVSCSACHQLDTNFVGQQFSGNLIYDTTHTIFGPYFNPFSSPMQGLVGFDVIQSTSIVESVTCASCHTLITNTVDLDGNLTGDQFTEQATYHEWTNSIYDQDETRQECQHCHVPRIEDEVALALDYSFIGGRSPFGKHEFSGANIFMLKLMKDYIDTLGINARPVDYDSSIVRTERMLRDCTLTLELVELDRSDDSVYYALKIQNQAGHKFPSGYPSRRASVQFIVKDENGDTLFNNGSFDDDFEVFGHSSPYENHHQVIRNEEDVQIYEMVFVDVNGDKTTILERGYESIKDNRIPPQGFTASHFSYDTVAIKGLALMDIDFNYENDSEGSGSDIIYYSIALDGYDGELNTRARIFYQTAPPAWMVEMFEYESDEILLFKDMFDNADRSPFLVAEAKIDSVNTAISESSRAQISIYPNPSNGRVFIEFEARYSKMEVEVYDINGKRISYQVNSNVIDLPSEKGLYILKVRMDDHNEYIKRIIRY